MGGQQRFTDADVDNRAKNWLLVVSAVGMAISVACFLVGGLFVTLVGVFCGSLVPAVALGLHMQQANRRAMTQGEILQGGLLMISRGMWVGTIVLAALNGYGFTRALEQLVFG